MEGYHIHTEESDVTVQKERCKKFEGEQPNAAAAYGGEAEG